MTDLSNWVPLSRRSGKLPEEALIDGVPRHLWVPLTDWLGGVSVDLRNLGLRLRVTWEPGDILTQHDEQARLFVKAILKGLNPEETMLDAIEGALVSMSSRAKAQSTAADRKRMREYLMDKAFRLDEVLELGGSRWISNDNASLLVERVEPAVAQIVEAATTLTQRSSASEHLRAAWAGAYGRHPNPGDSFGESIKAVEAAAATVVTPNDLKATLGKIIGELKSNRALWHFAIAPGRIEPVLVTAEALWNGQTDRHGGVKRTVPIEPEAARAAVTAAATLVHWFASGQVVRK